MDGTPLTTTFHQSKRLLAVAPWVRLFEQVCASFLQQQVFPAGFKHRTPRDFASHTALPQSGLSCFSPPPKPSFSFCCTSIPATFGPRTLALPLTPATPRLPTAAAQAQSVSGKFPLAPSQDSGERHRTDKKIKIKINEDGKSIFYFLEGAKDEALAITKPVTRHRQAGWGSPRTCTCSRPATPPQPPRGPPAHGGQARPRPPARSPRPRRAARPVAAPCRRGGARRRVAAGGAPGPEPA